MNEFKEMRLLLVDPQPTYIESSGRWNWVMPEHAWRPGCCKSVCTASREWWEYLPSDAKPHAYAEAVQLRDGIWYWAIPVSEESNTINVKGPEVLWKHDGCWLSFSSMTGSHALISLSAYANRETGRGGVVGLSIRQWIEENRPKDKQC